MNKDLENAWAVQWIRQEKCAKLEEENKKLRAYVDNLDSENDNQAIEIEELKKENKKLKEELKKTNELLSNVARCSEQYRGKMISVMEELKMFLYKD